MTSPPPAFASERESLERCAVDLEGQRSFRRNGFLVLGDLWSDELSTAIAEEATALWPLAELPAVGPRTPVSTERAALRQTPVATGPLLDALHTALARLARTLSGRPLVPSFAAYGFYDADEECILHYDIETSEVTLLIMALGAVGALHVHPELQGIAVDELGALESDPDWDRHSGDPVSYPRAGLTALRGQVLPHHRPPHAVAELSAVAALHYRSVF